MLTSRFNSRIYNPSIALKSKWFLSVVVMIFSVVSNAQLRGYGWTFTDANTTIFKGGSVVAGVNDTLALNKIGTGSFAGSTISENVGLRADNGGLIPVRLFTKPVGLEFLNGPPQLVVSTYTIEMVINLGDNSTKRRLMGFYDLASNNKGSGVYLNTSGNIDFYTTASNVITGTTLSPNAWYHLVFTRNSSGVISCYVNSRLAGTYTDSGNDFLPHPGTSGYNIITFLKDGGGFESSGKIAGLSIYNEVLSSSGVQDLFNNVAAAGLDSWKTTGNTGTTASSFIGTRDNQPLIFKANNTEAFRVATSGAVGIGLTNPSYELDVNGPIRVGSLPVDPTGASGAFYYNSASNKFKWYANGAWKNFLMEGDSVIASINGVIKRRQNFATGTSGNNFNISSTDSTHTFNIPDASDTSRGFVSRGTQTFAGLKSFSALASGGIAPPTTGATKMVITDANGRLSFATTPAGGDAFLNGTQTFGGSNTFSNGLNKFTSLPFTDTTQQIVAIKADGTLVRSTKFTPPTFQQTLTTGSGITSNVTITGTTTTKWSNTQNMFTYRAYSGGGTSTYLYMDNSTVRFGQGSGTSNIYNGISAASDDLTIQNIAVAGRPIAYKVTATGYHSFQMNNIERARINSTGLMLNGTSSGNVTIAPAATVTNWTFTLPNAAPAISGYVLSANTGGISSWVPQSLGVNVDTARKSVYTGALGAMNVEGSNFIGSYAGKSATNAEYSNFFGNGAGQEAANAKFSNFVGVDAGLQAINAEGSNFLGGDAGFFATNASGSNFLGRFAGNNATDASGSNFLGGDAGSNAANASFSNFFGPSAGLSATDAGNSNFFGYAAGFLAANAKNSIFIGENSGNEQGLSNTKTNNGTNDYSILLGRYTRTGGFKNSILLGGSNASGEYVSNTAGDQFMLSPNISKLRIRSVDYNLESDSLATTAYVRNLLGNGGMRFQSFKNNEQEDSVLTTDINGNLKMVYLPYGSTGGGSGGGVSYTFENGVQQSNGHVTMGGTLQDSVRLNLNAKPFNFNSGANPILSFTPNGTFNNTHANYDVTANSTRFNIGLNQDSAGYGGQLSFNGFGNTDALWLSRFNSASDASEIRMNLGDEGGIGDKFHVGYQSGGSWNSKFVVQANGQAGVGTSDLNGDFSVGKQHGDKLSIGNNTWPNKTIIATGIDGQKDYTEIKVPGSQPNSAYLRINNEGSVGIGTTITDAGYKLLVNGRIKAVGLRVKAFTNWPDYVFDSTYQLRPLTEVEKFIKANKHLPEMPTADEVDKDGHDVSETQIRLLQKIEELTLYIIEQDKRVKDLEDKHKKLDDQNKQILQLQQQLDDLKKLILKKD